ncbi:phosphoribosylanthranilate isomerase [Phenylobacterium sp.]|uniref:phosphoribosylanthranilate isomerase n=1 Tax=Phenylobacterium sp. TaxID=1871053 RepID=UPI002715E4A5|nr:phosphoribosylanthranilate isomerase [Phenylobacterium sp.]MDO8378876.1 phosphoribosylanthranilate isomerase [Phenylobacterium sp.]
MTIATKICGLSTPEAVTAAVDGGASHIGFIFFPKSPRNIAPEAAARLTPPARAKNVKIVAVTVDPDDELLDRLATILAPDLIQLHGAETPARAREVARRTGAGVIKVIPISTAHDLSAAKAYEAATDHLMFEAKAPQDSELPGGNGARFDWSLMMGHRFQRPWLLAGGLDPWNVVDAVRLSGAPMVDVSSGVERGPGLKDPALITAFLDATRRA